MCANTKEKVLYVGIPPLKLKTLWIGSGPRARSVGVLLLLGVYKEIYLELLLLGVYEEIYLE